MHMKSILLIRFDEPAKRFFKKKFNQICILETCMLSKIDFRLRITRFIKFFYMCLYEKRFAGSTK